MSYSNTDILSVDISAAFVRYSFDISFLHRDEKMSVPCGMEMLIIDSVSERLVEVEDAHISFLI